MKIVSISATLPSRYLQNVVGELFSKSGVKLLVLSGTTQSLEEALILDRITWLNHMLGTSTE